MLSLQYQHPLRGAVIVHILDAQIGFIAADIHAARGMMQQLNTGVVYSVTGCHVFQQFVSDIRVVYIDAGVCEHYDNYTYVDSNHVSDYDCG